MSQNTAVITLFSLATLIVLVYVIMAFLPSIVGAASCQ